MSEQFINELTPQMLGIQSLVPTGMHDSSARAQMNNSHFSQRVVLNKHDEKVLISGVEKKFTPFTFNVKMPCDGKIVRVIHKYDPKGSINVQGKQHTNTIVIYQRHDNGKYGYFDLPYFHCNHQIFGFKYVPNYENISKIKQGEFISKDTIFADAPTVGENGTYDYGVNANIAFMSMKAVAEDGFIASDRFLDRLGFKITEKRQFGIGASSFALNLYGKDATDFKPFPELGDKVRDDGVLVALRDYDSELNPVEMSIFDMQEINYIFDKRIHVKAGGGKVVDITVIRNNEAVKYLPTEISGFLDKYADAYEDYNRKIYETYLELKKETKRLTGTDFVDMEPSFHNLVVDAMAICNVDGNKIRQPLKLLYRKQPIDEYFVDITIEHDIVPDYPGFKLSDSHGSKGIVCKIVPWQQMPCNEEGVYADLVTDSASVINRMNIGRLYEHQITGAARDVTLRIRKILGVEKVSHEYLMSLDDKTFNNIWSMVLDLHKCIDGEQYKVYSSLVSKEDISYVLEDSINSYVKILLPIDRKKSLKDISKEIEKVVKPCYSKVTFYDPETGKKELSQSNIRIGMCYMIVLNKIADDGSSVAISKQQHFGIPTSSTKNDKYANAWRNSAVRTDGESEVRIKVGYCGEELQAETMDLSNSPMSQRAAYDMLLTHETPSNIDRIIDRTIYPLGTARPIQITQHTLMCCGFSMASVVEMSKQKGVK